MKLSAFVLPITVVGAFAACVQAPSSTTLEHVSPAASALASTANEAATLVVYSAFEVGPGSPNDLDADHRHHTDYEVRDAAGTTVTRVRNRATTFGEAPANVTLRPGAYQVVARSNGFGYVTVPITLTPARVFVLHLEGEPSPTGTANVGGYDLVRLPGGQVAGWSMVATNHR